MLPRIADTTCMRYLILITLLLPQPTFPAEEPWYELLKRTQPANSQVDRIERSIRYCEERYALSRQLIEAIMRIESGGRVCPVSSAGAIGLMQVLPATAKSLGIHPPTLFDPEINIATGCFILHDALRRAEGNVALAAAIYNFGPKALLIDPAHWPNETLKYVGFKLPRALIEREPIRFSFLDCPP
ncbi:MAG: lytic transglycosylase domain-containing protein [Pseudomonadota bacterium]